MNPNGDRLISVLPLSESDPSQKGHTQPPTSLHTLTSFLTFCCLWLDSRAPLPTRARPRCPLSFLLGRLRRLPSYLGQDRVGLDWQLHREDFLIQWADLRERRAQRLPLREFHPVVPVAGRD